MKMSLWDPLFTATHANTEEKFVGNSTKHNSIPPVRNYPESQQHMCRGGHCVLTDISLANSTVGKHHDKLKGH